MSFMATLRERQILEAFMSRRNVIRIVSFPLAVAIFCGIWAFKTHKENISYLRQMENGYSANIRNGKLMRFQVDTENLTRLLLKLQDVNFPRKQVLYSLILLPSAFTLLLVGIE